MLQILITNQHTANFGDDAAGVAMALQIRQQFPDGVLHFVYNWPWEGKSLSIPFHDEKTLHHEELIIRKTDLFDAVLYVASKFIPLIKLHGKAITDYINLVREADFVIVSPGGSNIGIYQDWICLFRVLVAVLEKKRPIFYLNSIGKSGNFVFDTIAKFILKRSQVFVREKKSHQDLKKWGICNVRGVDTAFSLSNETNHLTKTFNTQVVNEESKSIIFIPTRLGSWHPLYQKMNLRQKINQEILPSLITFSQKNNLKIAILPHLYGVLSEQKFLKKIHDTFLELGLTENNLRLLENINTFRDYENCIAHSKLVVSMRYHGVILSIKNGIPFISLAYENKMKEACMYSEMLNFNFNLSDDNFKQQDLVKSYEEAYKNRDEISQLLNNKLPILSELSKLPIGYLYLKRFDLNLPSQPLSS